MKVLMIGGGRTAYFLARRFSAKGYEVVVVNRERAECVELARELRALVICGDGSDVRVLEEAQTAGADVALAMTPNDATNLVICQLAALQFEVPRTLALVNDPENAEVFSQLGVTTFSTTDIVGSLIEQRTAIEDVLNLLPIREGRVNVTEIVLSPEAPVCGKLLREVALPENALVAVVERAGEPTVPHGQTRLLSGDRVVLITLPSNHGSVLQSFTGSQR